MKYEEFEDYQAGKPEIEPVVVAKKVSGKDDRQYKGLCVNCDHRETCPKADLEGGFWDCEDY